MASLGQQLKKAREERGVSIHDIAAATHLGARFLQAIENDDYKILPGGVFNRASLSQNSKLPIAYSLELNTKRLATTTVLGSIGIRELEATPNHGIAVIED